MIIENKALGYRIYYQLETFKYDFKNHYSLYTGYPFFQPMKGGTARQRQWDKKRSKAYYGSLMHFMRSVYRNRIVEEGFEVRGLKKVPNKRVQIQINEGRKLRAFEREMDTNSYYYQIGHADDFKDVIGKSLTGDSIAYAASLTIAGLYFEDFLLVIYKSKPAPPEYELVARNGTAMMSQIVLISGKPIEIESNGSYYDPADLLTTGYWAWSEKIAMMLPFDYKPGSSQQLDHQYNANSHLP